MKARLAVSLVLALAALHAEAADPAFGRYWNRGKAEITTYHLDQARYGNLNAGEAVTIFVTEPFSTSKQVKADDPGADSTQVLKMNQTRKFLTGIYPYSMMLSVFTPVDRAEFPRTLKASVSSQEWCGHTWTQFNWRDGGYQVEQRSYFESEGDRDYPAGDAMLEDAVWTRIRIAPETLPVGEIEMIPGGLVSRLRHWTPMPQKATAKIAEQEGGENVYSVEYTALKRTLKITYGRDFPHPISGWEETGLSGFGDSARLLTTKATLDRRLMIDYWRHHQPEDRKLRAELGLPTE